MRFLKKYIPHLWFLILTGALTAWTITAFSVHFSDVLFYSASAIFTASAIAVLALRRWSVKRAWLGFGVLLLASAVWFQTIRPSHDRDWQPEVAQMLEAERSQNIVLLKNMRDFKWVNETQATERWIDRAYDLDQITSVDMITSVWDNPDIAHLIVSFGFENQENVAFSVEIRKEQHESFNVVGGFFREFELSLVAATEEDVVKLRTNHRQEDVKLFPVDLSKEQMQELFLSYVALAQDLAEQPQFYHTITANCTTTVAKLARVIKPDLKFDKRMVLSGQLPSLVAELGGFDTEMPIELRMKRAEITQKALELGDQDYSKGIRAGL